MVIEGREYKNYFYYYIVDCEHEGDVSSAENEVRNAGGYVRKSYWDGEDCGNAYVLVYAKDQKDAERIQGKLYSDSQIYKLAK